MCVFLFCVVLRILLINLRYGYDVGTVDHVVLVIYVTALFNYKLCINCGKRNKKFECVVKSKIINRSLVCKNITNPV